MAHGIDPSSDNGYFEVLIRACNKPLAVRRAHAHLKAIGRADLVEAAVVEKYVVDGSVLYSSAQSR